MTNPQTVMRWKVADAKKPGTPGYAADQTNLRSWIDSELGRAIEGGQLDPSDTAGVASFLATLGVTPEKGGGRFLYNEYMNRGGLAKFTGMARGGAPRGEMPSGMPGGMPKASPGMSPGMNPAAMGSAMGRNAVLGKYGAGTLGAMAQPQAPFGSYSNGSFGQLPGMFGEEEE